jgi:hypothetical protein
VNFGRAATASSFFPEEEEEEEQAREKRTARMFRVLFDAFLFLGV